MLKNVVLAIIPIFLLSLTPCAGQVSIDYGMKGGLNSSDIQSQQVGGGERRTAPAGGIMVMFSPPGTFAFQPELLYMGKGDKEDVIVEGGREETVTLKLNYLELPLLAKLRAPILGNAEAGVYAGPALALKLKEELTDPLGLVEPDESPIAKDTDLGAAMGIEFGFGLGSGRILLDLRVTLGVSDIAEGTFLRSDASNQNFSLMTGFAF